MWRHIANLSNVTVRPFNVPNKVWGKKLGHPAHWSDVSWIKILYEEGGVYDLWLIILSPEQSPARWLTGCKEFTLIPTF